MNHLTRLGRAVAIASASEALSDPDSVLERAGVDHGGLRLRSLRVRPDRAAAVIGFDTDATVFDGLRRPGYVRCLAEPVAAAEVASLGVDEGVAVVDPWTSVWTYPADRSLRRLGDLADAEGIKRLIGRGIDIEGGLVRARGTRVERLRYRPERRAVLALSLKVRSEDRRWRVPVHVRAFARRRGAAIVRQAERLSTAGVQVPPQVAVLAGGWVTVEGTKSGVDGMAALRDGSWTVDGLAEMLQALRRADVDLNDGLTTSGRRALSEVHLGEVDALLPSLGTLTSELRRRLDAAAPEAVEPAGTHGDLHLHQLVVGKRGAWLLDFERAGRGDPLIDVGTLVGELVTEGRHDLADRIASSSGLRRSASDLAFHAAVAIIERSQLPVRQLAVDWESKVEQRLVLARDLLVGTAATWPVVRPKPGRAWPAERTGDDDSVVTGVVLPRSRLALDVSPAADLRLPGLAPLLEQGGRLLRHRPGGRAVVDMGDRGIAKVVRPGRLAGLLAALAAAERVGKELDVRVPDVVEVEVAAGVVVLSRLDGSPAQALLVDATVPRGERTDLLARLGELATGIAGVSADGFELPDHRPAPLERWFEALELGTGRRADRHREVATALEAAVAGEGPEAAPALVHGDLHGRNVLTGERLGLIDVDGLSLGSPAADLGNLAAHAMLRAHQRGEPDTALADAAAVLGTPLSSAPEPVRAEVGATLLRLSCLYAFRARWVEVADRLLDDAAHVATP